MMETQVIVLMQSVHETLKMEVALEKETIEFRTVAKPRSLGSECGVALRISQDDIPRVTSIAGKEKCQVVGIFRKENSHWLAAGN
jgi:hypothetical protein